MKPLYEKARKQILSWALVIAMIATLTPIALLAQTNNVNATLEVNNPVVSDDVTTWDYVYFGNYYQSSSESKEPIKWRVLNVNGTEALLLSDMILDGGIPYNEEYTDVTWENCTMRSWLNNTFMNEAFTPEEQEAILAKTIINADNYSQDTSGGNDTVDNIFLLSISDVTNRDYGFNTSFNNSITRLAYNTPYAASKPGMQPAGSSNYWWLRSPGGDSARAAGACNYGNTYTYGASVNYNGYGVRPALYLDLSASIWSDAGTESSDENDIEESLPCGENCTWRIDENNILHIEGSGAIDSYTTNEPAPWYAYCETIKGIEISNQITDIGNYAFYDLSGITSVVIPDSVKSIGRDGFFRCTNLKSVTIGNGIKTIGRGAFSMCIRLTDISLPEGLATIEMEAFEYCTKLPGIIIPKSVTSIGKRAFYNCKILNPIWIKNCNCTIGTDAIHKNATIKGYYKSPAYYYAKEKGNTFIRCYFSISSRAATLSKVKYTYSGNYCKPSVTVKGLKKGEHYTVSYSNNKYVGTAKVTIKGIGRFNGSIVKTFKINPKGTYIRSLSAGSKAFTVKWKKRSTQTTGYQIKYSRNSNMSSAKTVTITSTSKVSKKIGNLYAKKRYYVQVRTYKSKNGSKYYSSWSSKKYVKTK